MRPKDTSGKGIVIPIDGPAGSGKSTMAKTIADKLGWDYLESGALYRAVGLSVLEAGGSPEDKEVAIAQAENLDFGCRKTGQGWRNFLNDQDATENLREERVSDAASKVSTYPGVRAALLEFQRSYGLKKGAVIDGRDIGTVVFPGAQVKFFLDADIEVRIQRRFGELREKGVDFDPETLGANLRERDRRDREREQAPLVSAEDAIRIETTSLSIDQVLEIMISAISDKYPEVFPTH
jgi:CMP/dCMP kinase